MGSEHIDIDAIKAAAARQAEYLYGLGDDTMGLHRNDFRGVTDFIDSIIARLTAAEAALEDATARAERAEKALKRVRNGVDRVGKTCRELMRNCHGFPPRNVTHCESFGCTTIQRIEVRLATILMDACDSASLRTN